MDTATLDGLIEKNKLDKGNYVFGGIFIFDYLYTKALQEHGIQFKRIN